MAAHNGFVGFDNTTVSSFHTIDPPGFIPKILAGIAPIGNWDIFFFVIADTDRRAGDPTMDKNVMFGFKVIHHCRNNGLNKRILHESFANFPRLGKHISCGETGQLGNGIHRAVEVVVAL